MTHVPLLRFTGSLATLSAADRRALTDRGAARDDKAIRARTAEIIARVRDQGDSALYDLARELDGVHLAGLEVPQDRWAAALEATTPSLRRAMERAITNIATAHRAFRPRATEVETEQGVVVGRRPDPLSTVGVYVPGGRAAYPSSVLMTAVPARVAGVATIVLCSPPGADGLPAASVLAAAQLTNVDRVFAIGGAGAIAAMAYGTDSVPRVDRIVGPGNAYVAEAKLQVADQVAIDSPAGPSELAVVADDAATPEDVAREMLAQAEHDPRAAVLALAIGDENARRIVSALAVLLPREPRCAIIADSLAHRGGVLTAASVEEALAFATEWSPEHLLLAIAAPEQALSSVRNAGTVFLGATSSVVFGDYVTGANHVLPTGGSARAYSGLSTLDFVRWTTYQRVDRAAAVRLAPHVAALADAEGLPAHAAAARAVGQP